MQCKPRGGQNLLEGLECNKDARIKTYDITKTRVNPNPRVRTVLTRRVSSYGLPAWVSSELGPMGGTTFTTSAAALEPGHY